MAVTKYDGKMTRKEIIKENKLPLKIECKMEAVPYRNRRTEGHINREEPMNLYGAWIFSAENPQYKSWIIYSLFPLGACV